jgi:beta-galactosidase
MRTTIPLKYDWKFSKARNVAEGENLSVDDGSWQTVRVPHDWAITGPFDSHHDVQLRINELLLGRTGGLPHVGMAWYRKRFNLPQDAKSKRIWVEFDGVMSRSTVFVNGETVGAWPYGYNSFCFDITNRVDSGAENLLSVRVANPAFASRWYPGAGIYRNVRLVMVDPLHIAHWGTTVTTPQVSDTKAVVTIRSEIENETGKDTDATCETAIYDPDGNEVARQSTAHRIQLRTVLQHKHRLPEPRRWDIDAPHLYKAVTVLKRNGMECDRTETTFGIRTMRFDADEGFFLNERHVRLNGVCMHHDLGALGTAVNRRATQRQLEIMKSMGCNAIRTAHNPPSPEQLDACDRLGLLVIDEAYDEWRRPKHGQVYNGYNSLFHEWAERDLIAMIRRDRNHPSVIMWSIGNEIVEQAHPEGATIARKLSGICRREDPTRPTTAGFNLSDAAVRNGLADEVDIVGLNYKPHKYAPYHRDHPHWVLYGSETASCTSSRGIYGDLVVDACTAGSSTPWGTNSLTQADDVKGLPAARLRRSDLHVSAYDLTGITTPDYEFMGQDECPYSLGEFVWTGFDYLGEPAPYMSEWPSRSAYFGIVDTCGFPKDRFFLYKAKWSRDPVLHLLPHWTWPGHEGKPIPVMCYTNHPAAELFVNGKSQGVRRKNEADVFERYRLMWLAVPYEPGELKVVALNDAGEPVAEHGIETAGDPASVAIEVDRDSIAADGEDLAFVSISVLDEEGRACPSASNRVTVELDGPAELLAMDNGDPTDLEPFQNHNRRLFSGRALAIVRSIKGQSGKVTIRATSEGLKRAEQTLALN